MSSNNTEEVDAGENQTYVKLNFFVSVSLILLFLSISLLNENPLISLITLPIISILTYYEEKANFITILYGRFIYLFNSLGMVIIVIFWILPFFGIVQFLLLTMSSYVIFQFFERLKYFQEKTVLVIQNLLVVASFTILLYSFFPIIEFVYIQFIIDPSVLLISNILIHTFIVLAITLLSFYFLYARIRLYEKPWKLFNYCIVTLFLLLETTWFALVNIKNLALGILEIIQGELILYTILLPIVFLLFVLFNYIIRIFSREISLNYSYYACWFLLFSIFFTIIIIFWNNFVILLLDLIFLSVFTLINLRFGHILKKVKDSTFNFIIRVDSYAILIEIFLLFYGIFNFVFILDEFLALFLSCCVIGLIFNLIPSNVVIIPRKVKITLTLFILIFNTVIIGFFFLNANINEIYVYLIAPIIFCFLVFAPIYYLYSEKVLKPKFIAIYTYCSSWVLMFLFFALNFFIIVIYFKLHLIIGTIFNLLFITICLIFLISYGKKIRVLKESKSKSLLNIISYPIVLEVFAILITIFMIYLELDLLLSLFLSLAIISFIVSMDSKEHKLFPKVLTLILNSFTLYLGLFMVGYYSAIYTKDSFLVYFIPLILVSLLSYIPISYLHKKNVINKKYFLIYHFICSSIIVLSVFVFNFLIITTLFSPILNSLIILNILYITIACYYILKLGVKIDVISQEKVMVIENYISYLILLETFFIMFAIFNQQLRLEPFFSAYMSIVLTCLIINFFTKKRILFTEKISNGFNIVTLFFTSILISFYVNLFLSPSVYAYIIPLLILSITLLLPLFYSLNKNVFTSFVQKLLIIDSLVISGLIISLPYIIGLDFIRLGIAVDYYIINSSAIALFFGFLVFLEFLFDKYELKESYFVSIKTCQIITWVVLSFVISMKIFAVLNSFALNIGFNISCSSLVFLVLNLIILIPLENLKQRIFENDLSKYDYYRIYKIYEYTKNISYFFIEFMIASLTIFLVPLHSIYSLLQLQESLLLTLTTNVGIFLLTYLIISTVSRYLFEIEFSRLRWVFDISAWLIIKFLLCFYIIIFPAQLSLIQRIGLPLLIVFFLSPITIYFLRNNFFISDDSLTLYKRLIYYAFYFILIIIFSELYWNYSQIIPFYSANQPLRLIVLFCGIYSLFNYYLVKYNDRIENVSEFKLIKILLGPSLLLFTFFSIFPSNFEYFAYVFFVIMIYLLISNRNRNFVFRTIGYISLSLLILVKLITTLNYYMLIPLDLVDFSYYLFYFSFSLMIVLFFSIVLNIRNVNVIEKFTLYTLISIITFLLLLYNTIIPLIYIISFSLFLFLLLTGNFYYRKKNDLYKWFIRPCVLLMVFSLISFISYNILFTNPIFIDYNPILTFTLTLSVTSICYVGTYNKAPENFRRISFYIAFSSYIISIPTFMYFFLNASFNLPIWDPFLLIISINIGILLFYLSVGLYYWKFSWVIWKMGWRLWIIVPFVNFYIINESFTDINIYTNTLNFFGIHISGSFIIAFTICVLLSLPFWYTWIKKHFSRILLIVWSFSLFFLYWFSQNVFTENLVITNIVFFVFAVSLLMPVFYRMRMWKIITLLWLFYIFINVSFLVILFQVILLPLEINLSINLIVLGFFFIILSFFPNLKNLKNIMLASSYFISLIGVFLTIFFILNSIILNFFISINLSFIILAFSLFSSRLLKLSRTFFNIVISSILVVNFSFFTYNTFILIPNIEIIAVSLAITVFGGSTLVFNKYRMILPLKKIFPLLILSIGTSLTLSSLVYIFLPDFIFLVSAIFVFVNLIIMRSALYEYRFILQYISPLALMLLTLQFIVLIELFQSLYFIVLLSLLIYSAYFSVSRVLFKKKIEEQMPEKDYGMKKFDSILSLLSHFELGLLSFGLIQELININLYLYGAILLSVFIFFLSTLLDIHVLKRTIEKITYLLNIIAFLVITIGGLIYFAQFTGTDATLFVLNLVIFLVLQFYTLHYLSFYIEAITKYDANRIKEIRNKLQAILLNIIFLVISFYLSLLLTDFLLVYNPLLIGIPSFSFFLSVFSLLMFLLNGFLNRTIEIKYKNIILFSTFIVFQMFFGIFWLAFFTTFAILDFLRITLVVLSETILTAYTIHLSKGVIKNEEWVIKTKKMYSGLVFIVYLETSIVFLGLFGLYFGFFESLLLSQIILFIISILEIYGIKRLKAGYMDIVHCLSFFNSSLVLSLILIYLYGFSIASLFYISLLFLSMQFYTNISYFNFRSKFKPEKLEIFDKWKTNRQNFLGIGLYVFLIISIYNLLTAFGIEFHIAIFILSILTHLIGLLDKFLLKFLKKTSKFFIITTWIVMIGFSILFYIDWISLFFPHLIPFTIIFFVMQIAYLLRLISEWDYISSNISRINKGLILIIYFDLITWPLYYINPDYFISFNILIISFIILLILTFVDNYIKVVSDKVRNLLRISSFIFIETLLSLDIFITLEFFINPNLIFNLCVSLFIFMILNLILFKPFKRSKLLSFLYSGLMFLLLSLITLNLTSNGWSFSWMLIGTMLYLFIFMLEELKRFLDNIIDNIRFALIKFKNYILNIYYSTLNFLKEHFKLIAIILCLFAGIIVGVFFSEDVGVLRYLRWDHALLSGIATSGILISLLPTKKTDDLDQAFRLRMQRFITLWISFTIIALLLIIPFITSILFGIILILSSIIILGAILAIYIYRIEKKQKISIKWRFYTTILLIILTIIWVVLLVVLYFTEIVT